VGRRDAQRTIGAHLNQPMDLTTAGANYPEQVGDMLAALRAWEARRGLEATGMRQSMWYATKNRRKKPNAPNPAP